MKYVHDNRPLDGCSCVWVRPGDAVYGCWSDRRVTHALGATCQRAGRDRRVPADGSSNSRGLDGRRLGERRQTDNWAILFGFSDVYKDCSLTPGANVALNRERFNTNWKTICSFPLFVVVGSSADCQPVQISHASVVSIVRSDFSSFNCMIYVWYMVAARGT